MKYHLLENENLNSVKRKNGKYGWYYPRRRGSIQGIVIHSAEGNPAKNVAQYLTVNTEPASAHVVIDESTIVPLLPDEYVAFHLSGYNSKSLALGIAYWSHKWGENLQLEDLMLINIAKWCKQKAELYNLPISRVNKSNWARGQKGFIHADDFKDSSSKTVNVDFPWEKLLGYINGEKPSFKRQAPPWCGRVFAFKQPSMKGADIAQWQDAVGGLVADGLYGKLSVGRCKELQREAELIPDGLVGPQTWYATFQLPKRGN